MADVTGDGRADLVVTEMSANDAERGGTSFVVEVSGPGGDLSDLAVSSFSVGAGWYSEELAAVGDGDGPAGLALGLYSFEAEPWSSAVWVVPGGVLARSGAHTPDEGAVMIVHPEPSRLGGTVNGSWDLDEDGQRDLVLGGYEVDGTTHSARGWLLLDAASR